MRQYQAVVAIAPTLGGSGAGEALSTGLGNPPPSPRPPPPPVPCSCLCSQACTELSSMKHRAQCHWRLGGGADS